MTIAQWMDYANGKASSMRGDFSLGEAVRFTEENFRDVISEIPADVDVHVWRRVNDYWMELLQD